MANEFEPVCATPELMADLIVRRGGDTGQLTQYAITHGVELPEDFTLEWEIATLFDCEGNELGLFWINSKDFAYEDID